MPADVEVIIPEPIDDSEKMSFEDELRETLTMGAANVVELLAIELRKGEHATRAMALLETYSTRMADVLSEVESSREQALRAKRRRGRRLGNLYADDEMGPAEGWQPGYNVGLGGIGGNPGGLLDPMIDQLMSAIGKLTEDADAKKARALLDAIETADKMGDTKTVERLRRALDQTLTSIEKDIPEKEPADG